MNIKFAKQNIFFSDITTFVKQYVEVKNISMDDALFV